MLRGAALLAFAQLATAFREVSDPSRPCSERNGCQACLDRNGPTAGRELCTWCAATQRCTAVAPTAAETAAACPEGLLLNREGCTCAARSYTCEGCLSDPSCAFVPRYRGESSCQHPGAVAPAAVGRGPSNLRPENLRVALGLPTVVMGAPVNAATPEVIPAARVATDTDAPPPYAVVVGRALSGTGPAAMM